MKVIIEQTETTCLIEDVAISDCFRAVDSSKVAYMRIAATHKHAITAVNLETGIQETFDREFPVIPLTGEAHLRDE